ncbi:MAG: DNA-3-methyladenine glycosylase 2 family protein [Patescibacteria group bacterium]
MDPQVTAALTHWKESDPVLYTAALPFRSSLAEKRKRRVGNSTLFSALASSVVSQQLATKAADSIWERVRKTCGGKVTPETISKTRLPRLRAAGLSAAKAKTLKELAKAVKNGLDLSTLARATKEEATERLTVIWGIGPWTCEMFLMFAAGHPDIFSPRDLGLVRSMETLYGLKRGTSVKKLEMIALKWSPYRTLACRVLWRSRDSFKNN